MAKAHKKTAKKKKGAGPVIHCTYDKLVDTGRLKPNPHNPNTHPEEQVDRLALLISKHGWRHPITVSNRSGFVVSGHCRLLAAQKLGLQQVPVDYQDFGGAQLPCEISAEEMNVLLSDNAIQVWAEIDGLKMADNLVELDQLNCELELTGLKPEQIEDYVIGPTSLETDPKDDEIPEPPKKPITKTGDLWILGQHRLLCGDCTTGANVKRLMGNQKADMVFTDPPYDIQATRTGGKFGASGKGDYNNVKVSGVLRLDSNSY